MTINEVIKFLSGLPEEEKNLPLYVFSDNSSLEIRGISLYDSEDVHSKDNPLSIDFEEEL